MLSHALAATQFLGLTSFGALVVFLFSISSRLMDGIKSYYLHNDIIKKDKKFKKLINTHGEAVLNKIIIATMSDITNSYLGLGESSLKRGDRDSLLQNVDSFFKDKLTQQIAEMKNLGVNGVKFDPHLRDIVNKDLLSINNVQFRLNNKNVSWSKVKSGIDVEFVD